MGLSQNGKSIRFQTSLTTSRYTRKKQTCNMVEGMVGHEPEMKLSLSWWYHIPQLTKVGMWRGRCLLPVFLGRCFYGDSPTGGASPTDCLGGCLYTVALFTRTASFSVLPSQMVLGSACLGPALVTTTGAFKNLSPSVSPKQ